MKRLALVSLLIIALAGTAWAQPKAEKGYTQAPSGALSYKFHKTNKKGQIPKEGEILFLNLSVKVDKPDTLLFSSADVLKKSGLPYFEMLGKPEFKGDYSEVLALMHIGDSVIVKLSADTFFHYIFQMDRPNIPLPVDSTSKMVLNIKLTNIMVMDSFKVYYTKLEAEKDAKAFADEKINIDAFIATNNIKVTPTPSGIYYIETKPGTGPKGIAGDTASVKYTGLFLDGSIFDSNEDSEELFDVVLGSGMVIPGFDEALQLMTAGSEGTVIIPYRLAYGTQGAQGVIPPYTPIIFNLKMIKLSQHK
jgi:FKBP-type peptidyl-prolyl cis-trans isomerase